MQFLARCFSQIRLCLQYFIVWLYIFFYFAYIICEWSLERCKLIHEAVPSTEPDEIEKYTETLNRDMGFSGKNIIKPCDLDPNPMKKEHIKGMMNQGKCLM